MGEAWILTIGNELLIGRIVNTNAAWLAKKLTFLGFNVKRIIVAPDNIDDIVEELRRSLGRAKIIITTGGLGPTYDDRTLEGVAVATGRKLVLNREAEAMVREFYARKGLPLTSDRLKMAMLPEGSKPIPNPVGAAPGVLIEVGSTIIISLPGVPAEMMEMFEKYVEPLLKNMAPRRSAAECGFTVIGVPESSLAPYLRMAAKKYPHAYIKSHPKGHETENPVLDVRILVSGESDKDASSLCEKIKEELIKSATNLGGRIINE